MASRRAGFRRVVHFGGGVDGAILVGLKFERMELLKSSEVSG